MPGEGCVLVKGSGAEASERQDREQPSRKSHPQPPTCTLAPPPHHPQQQQQQQQQRQQQQGTA